MTRSTREQSKNQASPVPASAAKPPIQDHYDRQSAFASQDLKDSIVISTPDVSTWRRAAKAAVKTFAVAVAIFASAAAPEVWAEEVLPEDSIGRARAMASLYASQDSGEKTEIIKAQFQRVEPEMAYEMVSKQSPKMSPEVKEAIKATLKSESTGALLITWKGKTLVSFLWPKEVGAPWSGATIDLDLADGGLGAGSGDKQSGLRANADVGGLCWGCDWAMKAGCTSCNVPKSEIPLERVDYRSFREIAIGQELAMPVVLISQELMQEARVQCDYKVASLNAEESRLF
ncbi:MAG: hypothetical protein AAGA88_04070 [Pseudomonadota bacterium]